MSPLDHSIVISTRFPYLVIRVQSSGSSTVPAVVCLTASSLVSIALICFLCVSRHFKDREPDSAQIMDGNTPSDVKTKAVAVQRKQSFKKWNIGERLVIYLALADMAFEVSHIMDHAYVMYAKINPTDQACSAFGFMLTEFVFAQWIIVLYTALSACCLIVFNKKLHLGRLDWRLITIAFGSPMIIGTVAASLGLLGQNGVWWGIFFYIFICMCSNHSETNMRHTYSVPCGYPRTEFYHKWWRNKYWVILNFAMIYYFIQSILLILWTHS